MITDRDLDRQLGSWFEGRATSVPPDDLLERGLARVAVTRQRPGWLVPDRWRSKDGRTRPESNPARVGLALVALLAVAVAASAVGAWLSRPPNVVVPPLPAPSPSIVPTPSPDARQSELPSPERIAALPLPASRLVGATDFLLASDTVGWVATPLALYRTQDAGATWTSVWPRDWSGQSAVLLFDSDTAYLASSGSPATIAATHDGGATWIQTTLADGGTAGGPVFSFQKSTYGFATFSGTTGLKVYATVDGGVTWTGPKDGAVPHMAASFDKVAPPIGGFLVQSAGKFDNKPFDNRFFLSDDGGVTWTTHTFPTGAYASKDTLKEILGVLLEGNGLTLFAVDGDREAIYEGGADPSPWRLVDALPADASGAATTLLSPTEWIFASRVGTSVTSTVDGGANLRTVVARTVFNPDELSFASPDRAWATETCSTLPPFDAFCDGTTKDRVLLSTSDGGATWTRLGQ